MLADEEYAGIVEQMQREGAWIAGYSHEETIHAYSILAVRAFRQAGRIIEVQRQRAPLIKSVWLLIWGWFGTVDSRPYFAACEVQARETADLRRDCLDALVRHPPSFAEAEPYAQWLHRYCAALDDYAIFMKRQALFLVRKSMETGRPCLLRREWQVQVTFEQPLREETQLQTS
jgi:hypothetical protein